MEVLKEVYENWTAWQQENQYASRISNMSEQEDGFWHYKSKKETIKFCSLRNLC